MSKNFTYKKDGNFAVFFFVGSSERFCKKGKKLSVVVKDFAKKGKGATKKTEAGELPSFVL